ncbi:MAG: hypothetical protein L0338_30480, partial [Acidobacteria bacterium]|nr:hypothetical protein [Acidobacteriota bacterium]
LLPLNALEGHQKVAQGKRGAGATGPPSPLAPPWVKSSDQFSPLPPNRPPLGDSGGEVGRGGPFVAEWRLSRFVVV